MSSSTATTSGPGGKPSNKVQRQQGQVPEDGEVYDDKDEAYFGYYALLSHQAQMLQDSVRTAAYHQAIHQYAAECFQGKVVMDVGAGNGILSFFSAQAGARKVYAVEASNMVDHLHRILTAARGPGAQESNAQQPNGDDEEEDDDTAYGVASTSAFVPPAPGTTKAPRNPWLADTLVPVHSKVEDVTSEHLEGNQQVDTIVSECLGVLLVHERMCESFIDARDRFLKPGGSVFPSAGTICLAPFEDKTLWEDTANKARWWRNNNFYGVDITPFASAAFKETFSSPIVGVFAPQCLLSVSSDFVIDFATISKSELQDFTMPLEWTFVQPAIVHGLGGWFDLHFNSQSSAAEVVLPTEAADKDGDATMQEPASAAKASTLSGSAPDFQPSSSGVADAASTSNVDIETVKAAAAVAAAAAAAAAAAPGSSSAPGQFMSTSPYATPTHWQQVRFLFSDPIAVNKGQKLIGSIRCQVNDSRSYTMTGRFDILRSDGTADPLLQRKGSWRLDRQTYSWS